MHPNHTICPSRSNCTANSDEEELDFGLLLTSRLLKSTFFFQPSSSTCLHCRRSTCIRHRMLWHRMLVRRLLPCCMYYTPCSTRRENTPSFSDCPFGTIARCLLPTIWQSRSLALLHFNCRYVFAALPRARIELSIQQVQNLNKIRALSSLRQSVFAQQARRSRRKYQTATKLANC